MLFFPISTDTPIRRTPWVNYGLILVNVLVFLLTSGVDEPRGQAARQLGRWVELSVLDGSDPQLYQFFTYQFLHANFAHIAGNMLFLWIFGNPVNAKMGHGPYICFYLAGGVFAATGYGFFNDNAMVGASGAIAAVTTAYLALFPRSHITIVYWFFFIGTFELPSMWMILGKMVLWDNILGPMWVAHGESNVAFGAHLAGYAFGFSAAAGMLALRFLPRDQFDIVAIWRRSLQRRGMQAALADPNTRARAQFGRVARPVPVDGVDVRATPDPMDQITDLRVKIAESLARNDRDTAAELYERVLEMDPRQVLGRAQQLDVANQLYTLNRLPQAAAAYEKYLSAYPISPEADHVKLLLGIIYARDLHQFEVAQEHLKEVVDRLADDRRREQARHWMEVSARELERNTEL
ncbi:MAG: hypothetical protein AMXMBFR13_15220 [Phycisphaerae bacterium]